MNDNFKSFKVTEEEMELVLRQGLCKMKNHKNEKGEHDVTVVTDNCVKCNLCDAIFMRIE